jgi:hypothetical protein
MTALEVELELKKLSGDWDIEERLERRKHVVVSEDESGEAKPKRGRKPKAEATAAALDAEVSVPQDIAAGAEDQQPPQKRRGRPPKNQSGRDHLRLVK